MPMEIKFRCKRDECIFVENNMMPLIPYSKEAFMKICMQCDYLEVVFERKRKMGRGTRRVTIRLDEDTYRELRDEAEKRRITISDVIRERLGVIS